MEEKDICLCVTTYKKRSALIGWLDSVINFGRVKVVHIADDNDGECKDIAEDYMKRHENGDYPFPVYYDSGTNSGIAKNKNRNVRFFLNAAEAKDCKYLVLSDDDIKFSINSYGIEKIGDALVLACENAGIKHCTGYLGGSFGKVNDDGTVSFKSEPFFEQFPPKAEDEYLYYTLGGTQGILLFFYRELMELLGYMTLFPGAYGAEHACLSSRANRIEGRCPDLYAILKNCPAYISCQGIPNQYTADPTENMRAWGKYREEIYQGIKLSNKNSGL